MSGVTRHRRRAHGLASGPAAPYRVSTLHITPVSLILLGSAAGAIVNATMSPEAVMAYGWRIPFIIGLGVGIGGHAIRRHYIERVPHQAPAKSPLGEAFRVHWRTMVSRTGLALAPAMYLAAAAALTFVGALLLPKTPHHRLTKEFEAARFR